MKYFLLCLATLLLWYAGPASASAAPQAAPPENPFFAPSPLPFEAPPFDRIKDSDYAPAIEEGM
jgi:peptidyl-dipeptidase Dcp